MKNGWRIADGCASWAKATISSSLLLYSSLPIGSGPSRLTLAGQHVLRQRRKARRIFVSLLFCILTNPHSTRTAICAVRFCSMLCKLSPWGNFPLSAGKSSGLSMHSRTKAIRFLLRDLCLRELLFREVSQSLHSISDIGSNQRAASSSRIVTSLKFQQILAC